MQKLNYRWARLGDDGVESVDIIGGVVDGADGTIGFNQGVLSLHNITITALNLGFHISGETIMDSIVEGVLWVGLQRETRKQKSTNRTHESVTNAFRYGNKLDLYIL